MGWEISNLVELNLVEPMLHMSGYYKDQTLKLGENLADKMVGVNPPKLYATDSELSATGEKLHVGNCNFKYDNLNYPHTLGNEDGTWSDMLRCHVTANSNYHGPVNVEVTSDTHGKWTHSMADKGRASYVNDDMNELYNIYIAPQIDSISHTSGSIEGGLTLEINGNKFLYNNDEAMVKVGYHDCLISERTATKIVCTIQPTDFPCGEAPNEYPAGPGMTHDVFYAWKSGDDWWSINQAMNNLDENGDASGLPRYYRRVNEDGHFALGPDKRRESHHGDGYMQIVRGWFIAPKSGYYQQIVTGDDAHRAWMNLENPMCPSKSNITGPSFQGNLGDMTLTHFKNHHTLELKHSAHHELSAPKWYNKGEMQYIRGAQQEWGGGDYLALGFKYLGDQTDGNGGYTSSEDLLLKGNFWDKERHQLRKDQKNLKDRTQITYCIPDENGDGCSTDTSYLIDLLYTDQIGTSRQISLDLSAGEELLAEQMIDELFTTKCNFDETKFVTKYSNSWEDGENIWPHHSFSEIVDSKQSYCGRKHVRATDHFRWIYNYDIQNNKKIYDIMDDDITHMCFAYYGQVDEIVLTMKNNFWGWWHNWHIRTPELKSPGAWKWHCFELREFALRHNYVNMASGTSEGSLVDRGFTRLELANVLMKGDVSSNDRTRNAQPLQVDEFRLGFLLDENYEPERILGITADDGRTVQLVQVDIQEEDFKLNIYFDRDRTWQVPHNLPVNHEFTRNSQCNWRMEDVKLAGINGVALSESFKNDTNVALGYSLTDFVDTNANTTTVVGQVNHYQHPTQEFSGNFRINGRSFPAYTDYEELEKFMQEEFGYDVRVTWGNNCQRHFDLNIQFNEMGLNPPLLNYDISELIPDPQNVGDTTSWENNYETIWTVWEGGLYSTRYSCL